MGMKDKGRKIYRTMQGKIIDLDLLIKRNELTPAVGNARVNARGDELGAGGKIIRKREEVVKEYYKGNAPVVNEETSVKKKTDTPESSLTEQEKVAMQEFDDGWEEDAKGNFIKRGRNGNKS
jgi:hypothetical protein